MFIILGKSYYDTRTYNIINNIQLNTTLLERISYQEKLSEQKIKIIRKSVFPEFKSKLITVEYIRMGKSDKIKKKSFRITKPLFGNWECTYVKSK